MPVTKFSLKGTKNVYNVLRGGNCFRKYAFRRSGVFIVNFEHISHLVLVFLLLTLNMQLPAGKLSIIQFKFNHYLFYTPLLKKEINPNKRLFKIERMIYCKT